MKTGHFWITDGALINYWKLFLESSKNKKITIICPSDPEKVMKIWIYYRMLK